MGTGIPIVIDICGISCRDHRGEHRIGRREKRDVTNNLLKHKSKSEEGDQYVNLKDVALSRDTGKVPK